MSTNENADKDGMISFLDVIACAFGAIVLLVLILPVGDRVEVSGGNEFDSYEQKKRNTRVREDSRRTAIRQDRLGYGP